MQKEFLEAGKIVGTHGIRGELRVEPWCDSAGFLAGFKTLYWDKGATPVKVIGARVHKSLVLMRLEGVESATQGDLLRGKVLYLNRKDAKFQTGANDVYRIQGENGKDYLFPAVEEMIAETDLESGVIRVRPIQGIFDDEG